MQSPWSLLRGHDGPRLALARAIQAGRLTQGYVFAGPEGIGKQLFARGLAQSLLCTERLADRLEPCGQCPACRSFLAGSHPDFHLVQRDAGKRELTIDKLIGSREQRGKVGLCHDLSLHALQGSRKVALINDADTMNDETANALLKTLEEPPERAVLMLIASHDDALLPTIRSRCQVVRFDPLPDELVAELALKQGLAATEADAIALAGLAGGSLTAAAQLAAPASRQLRQRLLSQLSQPLWNGIAVARELAEAIDEAAADVPEQRVLAAWVLRAAVEFYRAALWRAAHPAAGFDGTNEAAAWVDRHPVDLDLLVDWLGTLIDRCLRAVEHLEQNVGVALCLEAAFADLARPGPGLPARR